MVEDNNSSSNEEEDSEHDSVRTDDPSIDTVETVTNDNDDGDEDAVNDNPPMQPEIPEDDQRSDIPVPAAVRKLQGDLGGYWNQEKIGSVLHEHCIGSVIREYNNLESVAVSATTQYGFQKGMKLFKDEGYKATIKELGKNLIGKNVIDMLPANSVTSDMIKMSLSYTMFTIIIHSILQ